MCEYIVVFNKLWRPIYLFAGNKFNFSVFSDAGDYWLDTFLGGIQGACSRASG